MWVFGCLEWVIIVVVVVVGGVGGGGGMASIRLHPSFLLFCTHRTRGVSWRQQAIIASLSARLGQRVVEDGVDELAAGGALDRWARKGLRLDGVLTVEP